MALLLAGLAACVNTPEARIRRNPDVFDSLNVVQQAQVRAGKVDILFTKDMVRLALGEPGQVALRRSANTQTEIWLYTEPVVQNVRQRISLDYAGPAGAGRSAWVTLPIEQERLRYRIEFLENMVSTIEEYGVGTRDQPATP